LASLLQIAQLIGSVVPQGAADFVVLGIKSLGHATEKDITFLSSAKYRDEVANSNCAAVIVRSGDLITGKICLEVADPYVAYALVAQFFEDKSPLFNEGISQHAIIDSSAIIDPSVSIGPGSVIGSGVRIGAKCRIGARCVIEKNSTIGEDSRIDSGAVIRWDTVIGDRVVVQSGAIIGSDGFGNARQKDGSWVRIPAFGNVIVGDDVEIGAGTTIDRGNFEPTIICGGVKLDNLIHVAHNVQIGDNTAIAAQTGISGSTKIGKRVIVGGQAGFVGHIEIGDDSFIGAKAGVSKDTDPASKITGYPARDLMTMRRIEAAQAYLPSLLKEIKQIRKKVDDSNK
jgi:UDP-3-O-[3-hydroxymyristoyl] glucosamine N-acyltransferase